MTTKTKFTEIQENILREVKELLVGAIDIHVHADPDMRTARVQNMIEVAQSYRNHGMRAVLFKDHDALTATSAYLVSKVVPGIDVFGGVTLNYSTGGLNPKVVKAAIAYGGKCIWMPALDSQWCIYQTYKSLEAKGLQPRFRHSGVPYKNVEDGLSVLEGGFRGKKLLPEAKEIVEIIAESNVILDTGHLSPDESEILMDYAKEVGVKKFVCNHVNSPVTFNGNLDVLKDLANKGAYVNWSIMQTIDDRYRRDPAEIVNGVKEIGAQSCILSTDLGQIQNIPAIEGMKLMIRRMLEGGMPREDLEITMKQNPAKVLDLK